MEKGKGIYQLIKESSITIDSYKVITNKELLRWLNKLHHHTKQPRISWFVNDKGEQLN